MRQRILLVVFSVVSFYLTSSVMLVKSQEIELVGQNLQIVAWQPTGDLIAVASFEGDVRIYTSELLLVNQIDILSTDSPFSLEWSRDGSKLAIGTFAKIHSPNKTYIWNSDFNMTSFIEQPTLGAGLFDISWHPNNIWLALTWNNNIYVWNIDSGNLEETITTPSSPEGIGRTIKIAWKPDGSKLAGGTDYGTINIWETANFNAHPVTFSVNTERIPVRAISWNTSGSLIAAVSTNNIKIWESTTYKEVATLTENVEWVGILEWNSDKLATAGSEEEINIWNMATQQIEEKIPTTGQIFSISWSPDGSQLAYSNINNNTITIYEVKRTQR